MTKIKTKEIISGLFLFSALLMILYSTAMAATFGKETNGASSSNSSADRKRVSSSTPATAGTLTSCTARMFLSAAGTGTVKGVVYSSVSGSASPLLATGDEVTFTDTAEVAINLPFSGAQQLSLVGGTEYFIGFHHADPGVPSITHSRDNNPALGSTNTDTYSDGPADPFGTIDLQTGKIDVFCTYTEPTTGGIDDTRIMIYDE